jgi:hypothetical protein
MAQKETANIVFLMLGIGSLGLLAATLGKGSGKVGEVVASGKETGGDGNEYDWRIEVMSQDPEGNTHLAKAKLPGFGMWDAESVVAMGPSIDAARGALNEYLSALA